MIPAALSSQLEVGLADFLRMSFWSSTPGMEQVIDRLLATPGAVLKGPELSASLGFERGGAEFFPEVPLGFPAHLHQEQAFRRLSGGTPQSTLIATGTGSGKTESFLWHILDHCRRQVGTPGIKAILVYPMKRPGHRPGGPYSECETPTGRRHRGGDRAATILLQELQMTMSPEEAIRDAIQMRKAIRLTYHSKKGSGVRIGHPHALYTQGAKTRGPTLKLDLWQTGGHTSTHTLPRWSKLNVASCTDVVVLDEPFDPRPDYRPDWYTIEMRTPIVRI